MTWKESYTSLKQLYNKMMFPDKPHTRQWTLTEIDQLDVHFFYEVINVEEYKEETYLSDMW